MKLSLDPRLPAQGSPNSAQSTYARLYDIFRQHAQAVNANSDAAAGAQSDANAALQAAQDASAAVAALENRSLWYGFPVGAAFFLLDSAPVPPTDSADFRYVILTAGLTGAGGYNNGALINETVTGSSPLLNAVATISLSGSPLNGLQVHLVNTEKRFIGAAQAQAFEDDSDQKTVGSAGALTAVSAAGTGPFSIGDIGPAYVAGGAAGRYITLTFNNSTVIRTSDHTQPRAWRMRHYMRVK